MLRHGHEHTGLPLPSYDLWEEPNGIFTFTCAAVYGGLTAAANFADAFGESDRALRYRQAAKASKPPWRCISSVASMGDSCSAPWPLYHPAR
jgi:GH15 family glucan-1,4-alpha-glucosidase